MKLSLMVAMIAPDVKTPQGWTYLRLCEACCRKHSSDGHTGCPVCGTELSWNLLVWLGAVDTPR